MRSSVRTQSSAAIHAHISPTGRRREPGRILRCSRHTSDGRAGRGGRTLGVRERHRARPARRGHRLRRRRCPRRRRNRRHPGAPRPGAPARSAPLAGARRSGSGRAVTPRGQHRDKRRRPAHVQVQHDRSMNHRRRGGRSAGGGHSHRRRNTTHSSPGPRPDSSSSPSADRPSRCGSRARQASLSPGGSSATKRDSPNCRRSTARSSSGIPSSPSQARASPRTGLHLLRARRKRNERRHNGLLPQAAVWRAVMVRRPGRGSQRGEPLSMWHDGDEGPVVAGACSPRSR